MVSAPGCGARVLVGLLATKRRGPARTNQYTITRPWRKGEAFGRIPNWIFVRPELSRQARYLYCDLVRRKNEARQAYCCPKQQALAASVGTAPRTVRRWLQELEEAGLLHMKQRKGELSNFYYPLPWTPPPTVESVLKALEPYALTLSVYDELGITVAHVVQDGTVVAVVRRPEQVERARTALELARRKPLQRAGTRLVVEVEDPQQQAV